MARPFAAGLLPPNASGSARSPSDRRIRRCGAAGRARRCARSPRRTIFPYLAAWPMPVPLITRAQPEGWAVVPEDAEEKARLSRCLVLLDGLHGWEKGS